MERCLQVAAINRRVARANGGWIVLTSIEIWDDRIIVRFVQDGKDPSPELEPGEVSVTMFSWDVNDDVGTEYGWSGGGSGGGTPGEPVHGTMSFSPAPPAEATRLLVFAPKMEREVPIEVALDR